MPFDEDYWPHLDEEDFPHLPRKSRSYNAAAWLTTVAAASPAIKPSPLPAWQKDGRPVHDLSFINPESALRVPSKQAHPP